ncbi:MAG TPA: Ig-like domain-containing protein [Candidatus Saccharimonadales bacterium]|nr:Ig-like domain-containing protein [Candidatus Saccharimonadales bacterium]
MSVRKRAITFLVAIFSVAGGVSLTASASPMPTDLTVSPAVMAVDAVDDVAKVNQDATVNINVLANDKGQSLKISQFTQAQNGIVKQSPEGGLRYTPNSGYNGLDSFSYTISDGLASDTAMVTITVDPVANPCQSNLNGLTGDVSFDRIHRTVTYKVILPHPICGGATLSGDTYVFPKTYDRSGEFNASATPAYYNSAARSDITIPRGYRIAQTTRPIDVSRKAAWVMGVVYEGTHRDEVSLPGVPGTLDSEVTVLPRLHWRHH